MANYMQPNKICFQNFIDKDFVFYLIQTKPYTNLSKFRQLLIETNQKFEVVAAGAHFLLSTYQTNLKQGEPPLFYISNLHESINHQFLQPVLSKSQKPISQITENILMHLNKDILLQTCKLSAALLLGLLFLPSFTFLFIFVLCSSFIIIPTLCVLISVYVAFLVINRFPIRSFVEIPLSFCLWILECSFNRDEHQACKIYQSGEDKAVSVVFDPSEIPSFEEFEEEEKRGDVRREENLCKYEDNKEREVNMEFWRTQSLKVNKRFEDKPFYEVLSFWKRKEGEENFWRSLNG